jgi:hypothetical protein
MWDGVPGQGRALGIATTYRAAVIALLRGSAVPMCTREVVARVGAVVLPPEVLRFDRGIIGLKQHFADFDAWCECLGPACLKHMLSAPQRQWSANELLRLLKAEGRPLPTDCTPWQLVALLRHSPGLRYLGRQRFSLDRSPPKRRTYHFEAIRHVLESQRAPMSFEEIVAALEPSMSVEREVVRATLSRRDFVQSADGAWSYLTADSFIAEMHKLAPPLGAWSVKAPHTALKAHRQQAGQGPVVGTLENGAKVALAEVRRSWSRLNVPLAGWVPSSGLVESCK